MLSGESTFICKEFSITIDTTKDSEKLAQKGLLGGNGYFDSEASSNWWWSGPPMKWALSLHFNPLAPCKSHRSQMAQVIFLPLMIRASGPTNCRGNGTWLMLIARLLPVESNWWLMDGNWCQVSTNAKIISQVKRLSLIIPDSLNITQSSYGHDGFRVVGPSRAWNGRVSFSQLDSTWIGKWRTEKLVNCNKL